ncbi:transketolase [Candidatus Parabeggiatoa sp. HSG14]|uniref:transketolase n=1 Tax=Candidatus Parabeggiatoa sp. HSG14 TaxID=3055593 RepID=UPI0025A8A11B|nr:transketolase [Thiotrichales bacterium HSG14]
MPSRKELANAIRALSMDAIQKANSGHPGAPMGMADIAEVLWNDYMNHNPTNPNWANRDRFILSNGHGSMLIYSLAHLTGYDLSMDDLKNFRQLHSKTPGHPEYGYAPAVETTTGPLGQGIANAVGMALAEKVLAGQFNRPDHNIIDHYTYTFLGDGCMMEGISHEVCSLAGTMELGKLIAFYDDNGISIDGEVQGWFADNTPQRFTAYGWHVVENVDGHDAEAIKRAIEEARSHNTGKPTLICCKTIIGWGSPNKQGKEDCHGAALGADEIALVRKTINWPHPAFEVPDEIYAGWDAKGKGTQSEATWNEKFTAYQKAYPELAIELKRRLSGELPEHFLEKANTFISSVDAKQEKIASRKASQNTLNGYGPLLPELLGGSADLAGSNLTIWSGCKGVKDNADGNYVYYGVREFGMSAMMNGIALHGGFIPYGATFLIFSEYARNALRMAALMKIRSVFVYTHDSIGLGEDGPTHQPIEQTATLRLIPNMSVWRPCDAVESAIAWKMAVKRKDGPSCLIFSRQGLPHQGRTVEQLELAERGGYILSDCEGTPNAIIIATGSEVELATGAAKQLSEKGKKIRVVSMPSTDFFDAQDETYRESVLPSSVTARVAVEAGVTDGWAKYVGLQGKIIGINHFGESAPAGALFKEFGFTVDNVVKAVEAVL